MSQEDRPVVWREVFDSRPFRFVYAATALSWLGDFMARAAVTALVYRNTGSTLLAAATFAITYLPAVVGGPVLAALAERHRHRFVMVLCDLVRMVLVAAIALPGMPLWAMLVLLFLAAMAGQPFTASRSALLPQLLHGPRYVAVVTLNQITNQASQVFGYLLGGLIAASNPRLAIAVNAVTFAVSAVLIRAGVPDLPVPAESGERRRLLAETADGFRIVLRTPVLRAIVLLVWAAVAMTDIPEGLAAAWAGHLGAGTVGQGWIMAAYPIGVVVGGYFVVRRLAPSRVDKLIRPLALMIPAALVVALVDPPLAGVVGIAFACGLAAAGVLGPANGLFVANLPTEYRARAFGVVSAGMQVAAGGSVMLVGLLANWMPIHVAVGIWGPLGLILLGVVALRWPKAAVAAERDSLGTPAEAARPR
jgi:MFS family permease